MAKINAALPAKAVSKIPGNVAIEIIDNLIKLATSMINAYKDIKVEQEKTFQFKIQLDSDLKKAKEHTQQIEVQETNKTIRSLAQIEKRLQTLKLESKIKLRKMESDREREHELFLLKYKMAEKLVEPLNILMKQWQSANENINKLLIEEDCDSAKLQRVKSRIDLLGKQMADMMAVLVSFANSNDS
jgi:hypothetical protein